MTDRATKLIALTIASISSFITPFMLSSINIALPVIGKEFKTDAVLLSWVATSYLLAAAVALVPFGKLADIYGRKIIFKDGQIFVAATSFRIAVSFKYPAPFLMNNSFAFIVQMINVLAVITNRLKVGHRFFPETLKIRQA